MLKGKAAVVTGSTSGIGLGIARALAREGANVVINGFGDKAAIEQERSGIEKEFSVKATYSPADMTKPAEIAEMIRTAEATFGSVDVLVNNAGIQHVAPIEEFPIDKWDAIIAINLSAAFHAMRAAVPGMKARKWGRIITTASAHSLVASPFKAAYVSAKHGLTGLTKTVALEVATFGITANCISPGYVWTPLVEKQIPDTMKARGMTADQILDDGRLTIEGISGASAGAVNAVMLADGLARSGPEEAKKRLAEFWRAASLGGDLPPLQRAAVERLFSFLPMEGSPMQAWVSALSRHLSPYDLNPLNINPLRELVERFVDFETLRKSDVALFVSATNVHTGRLRIFPREKITADVVMASACLPFLFRAVEIDGEPYWDGGYLANPPIFPFFSQTESEDVLIVQINPLARHAVPTSSKDIMNRINEITFNASLMAELRAIDFIGRLIDQGKLERGTSRGKYRRVKAHRIVLDQLGKQLTGETKLSTDYDFFEMLRLSGKRAARRFLDAHFDDIGARSTFDLRAEAQAEWA